MGTKILKPHFKQIAIGDIVKMWRETPTTFISKYVYLVYIVEGQPYGISCRDLFVTSSENKARRYKERFNELTKCTRQNGVWNEWVIYENPVCKYKKIEQR